LLAPELPPGSVPSRAPGNVDELGWSLGNGVDVVPPALPAPVVSGAGPGVVTGGGGPASGCPGVWVGAGGGMRVLLAESAGVAVPGAAPLDGGITVSLGL